MNHRHPACLPLQPSESLNKQRKLRQEVNTAAVYTAGKDEHLQIVLAQEAAFVLPVDARIAEDATTVINSSSVILRCCIA